MEAHIAPGPRLLAGAAFLAYFSVTALLYFLGPWTYPMPLGSARLITFLVAVHAAFAAGYLCGIVGRPRAARFSVPTERVVLLAAIIELILLFPTSALNTGHWIPNPFAAARDLGTAYSESLAVRQESTPYVNYVRMLLSPLLAATWPLALFYWSDLRVRTRLFFAASVVGTLALFVAMGANAGAAHWVLLFPWFVIAAHFSGRQRISRRGWIAAGVLAAVSGVLLVVLFTATMVQRKGSYARAGFIGGIGAYIGASPTPRLNPTSGMLESPEANRSAAKVGFDGVAAYLTQGYYAVYLSLQEPFVPCYGAGNSVFLQRQVARIASDEILNCPYPVRLQKRGWSPDRYWATIYPWIASDVTFPGTVVVVFLIALATGRVWMDVLGGRNPFAVAVLGQFLVMLYYFPAHNKNMHSGEGIVAFALLLGAWLVTRQRDVVA